jgi:hypothetical protein
MPISIIIPIHWDESIQTIQKCIKNIFKNCSNHENVTEIILVSSIKLPNFVEKKLNY